MSQFPRHPHDSSGNTTYTPGLGHRSNGVDRCYHEDRHGSTRYMSDSTGNSFPTALRYDAYGQRTATSGPAHPSDMLFGAEAGYQTEYADGSDPGLGLQYLRQRYYDPAVGRFLTPDPIGFAGGFNRFSYGPGDPVNGRDRSGTYWETIIDAVSLGISIGEFAADPSLANGVGVAVDLVSLALPTPSPTAIRHLDEVVDAINHVDDVAPALRTSDGTIAPPGYEFYRGAPADQTPTSPIGGAPTGDQCFVAGTPVAMGDGTSKPIEEVQPGDIVLSRSDVTGQTTASRVVQTFQRDSEGTLVLHLEGGERIETTREHPFFVAGVGWMPAGRLGIGTAIVTRAGPCIRITGIEPRSARVKVYNFHVALFHSYFAGYTAGGAWVHNTCPPPNIGVGTDVYRVWGGQSGPYGQSWTTVNPATISDYRNQAGLPDVNTGEYLSVGRIIDMTGVTYRQALSLDGNVGGLPEVIIPNAADQVDVHTIWMPNPPF